MNNLGKVRMVVIALSIALFSAMTVNASSESESLFVNLTNDDLDRAAMAINFSTRVREQKQIPVTIFLNVEGVRIADKRLPEKIHPNGQSLKQMLTSFMQKGGTVLVCPMCMKNVAGLSEDDLIEGAQVGSSTTTWPALFSENVTVLSY